MLASGVSNLLEDINEYVLFTAEREEREAKKRAEAE